MQCAKLKTYMETGRVVFLPARSIRPNPAQPRKTFDENALSELTESIRCHGVIQPLSVRRTGAGYELIAGERRLRAAQAAGLSEIPCIVMTLDDAESGLVALVENLQRQDLHFIEEALGISRLIRSQKLSQDQAARMLGKSQSAIANKLRLLRHSPEVLAAIKRGGLSERHARALQVSGRSRNIIICDICTSEFPVGAPRKAWSMIISVKYVNGNICPSHCIPSCIAIVGNVSPESENAITE